MPMRFNHKKLFWAVAAALMGMVSCGPDIDPVLPEEPETPTVGLSNIVNSYSEKEVSFRGGTISIRFDAVDEWTAELKPLDDTDRDWVSINENTLAGEGKKGSAVRVKFVENEGMESRSVELWVTVKGYDAKLVATLVQAASGTTAELEMNLALNTYMHDILKKDYLFADAYNSKEVDLTVSYKDFLATHLLALGDANIEDGGYYRASLETAGQRYIYSNIAEVQIVGASSTKAVENFIYASGLGFGPFISTALAENSQAMGIAVSYVRRGSPAEAAGLRRGDIIYEVNSTSLTTSNYRSYMNSLYQNPSGSYTFSFLRFEDNGNGKYELMAYTSGTADAKTYIFDPVLFASVLTSPNDESVKIGYLVYESFNIESQDFLESAIEEFVKEGITELILDLRFNPGGAVPQSRWLSGCIAGEANGSKTFTTVVYNDGSEENWTFDYGYKNDADNLGKPMDLGLERLYVIASYNTASASELLINSLRGIDFPVKVIGCRTEGKNVGMNVSETVYNGRKFHFSPVTFYVRNAKGDCDYADGIAPDEYVNNDNRSFEDDADNVFPYSFSNWGNMDYNIALQWAYCDITGIPRWTFAPDTKASASSIRLVPDYCQPMMVETGHFGNLIY